MIQHLLRFLSYIQKYEKLILKSDYFQIELFSVGLSLIWTDLANAKMYFRKLSQNVTLFSLP